MYEYILKLKQYHKKIKILKIKVGYSLHFSDNMKSYWCIKCDELIGTFSSKKDKKYYNIKNHLMRSHSKQNVEHNMKKIVRVRRENDENLLKLGKKTKSMD